MNKIKTVMIREFLVQIKKWGFWLGTLGLPLFIVISMVFTAWLGMLAEGSKTKRENEAELPRIIGMIDPSGLTDLDQLNHPEEEPEIDLAGIPLPDVWNEINLPESSKHLIQSWLRKTDRANKTLPYTYRAFSDKSQAMTALEAKEIKAFFVIDPEFKQNFECELVLYNEEDQNRVSTYDLRKHLQNRILGAYFDPQQHENILNPTKNLHKTIAFPKKEKEPKDVKKIINSYVLPIAYLMTMMMAIISSTDRLLRGMVEEKQNRVIEILLSSVSSNQLMAGKVLGLGLIGLTQLAIWLMFLLIPILLVVTFLDWSVWTLIVFLSFFLGGYLLLATCMLAFGSLGRDIQEAAQWSMVWIFLTLAPMFFLTFIIENPHSTLSQVLTYIPFTSSLTVIMRLGMGEIALWEVGLSWVILLTTVWLFIKFGAKLFRMGILMTGKAPNPLELIRMFRHAD
ncbi:MAG: ABC transporter permease [Acidobacteria bacterium]|nr:ABC transporter permease [Acidobacteriota bacterium]MCB9398757.1 ABC transporter permease [Acidobacteriota bacterium]